MPTARPFAYNPGSLITGTEQVGDIAVGITPQNYSDGYGGVRWWNGPDEELGYIICYSVPTEDHPSPDGPIAGVGFFRSKLLTESSFIEIAQYVSSGQTFVNGTDAKTWLNSNGYWTSYEGVSITPTPTVTPTITVTPTPSITPTGTMTPTPSPISGSVTGGTGTDVVYTTGTFFDAFSSQAGITNTDAFNTNNGCWQLYYAHQEVDMNSGTGNIGLNPYSSGTNSWTWYYAVSNSVNTIGDWSSVLPLSTARSGSYLGGVFTVSNINTNVTIPANTYFLIGNNGGPFFRTVKSLPDNRTATVGGSPFVTAVNKVCLGNWPTGGTTGIPVQFGGATGGYTFYGAHAHVHSVTFN